VTDFYGKIRDSTFFNRFRVVWKSAKGDKGEQASNPSTYITGFKLYSR